MTRLFLATYLLFSAGHSPIPSHQPRVSVWCMVQKAWRRHRSRQALAQLDARLLRDIGVTYAEAENEANKPFWRA